VDDIACGNATRTTSSVGWMGVWLPRSHRYLDFWSGCASIFLMGRFGELKIC
jgi:hypothetical protein